MYGWRLKIGVLTPANNVVIEPEFYRFAPSGVGIYTTRMLTSGTHSIKGLIEMEQSAQRGADELAATGVNVIVYACLSTSLAKEMDWSESLVREITKRTGIPATTASLATIEGLRALGLKKIAIGSPFPPEINDRVKSYLENYGFEIVAIESLFVSDEAEIGRIQPDAIYKLGKNADRNDAEGVCLLATDISTLDIIDSLERDLGKPTVTTNQAILWKTLGLGGVRPEIPNCGTLLRYKD